MYYKYTDLCVCVCTHARSGVCRTPPSQACGTVLQVGSLGAVCFVLTRTRCRYLPKCHIFTECRVRAVLPEVSLPSLLTKLCVLALERARLRMCYKLLCSFKTVQDLDKTQEDLMKHQTNISELKRTFLETSTETAVSNEWEKRLSTSPVRLAARQEEAPMIEPLVPEEVSGS